MRRGRDSFECAVAGCSRGLQDCRCRSLGEYRCGRGGGEIRHRARHSERASRGTRGDMRLSYTAYQLAGQENTMTLLDAPAENPQKSRAMAFTVGALAFVAIVLLYFGFRYYPEKRAAEH